MSGRLKITLTLVAGLLFAASLATAQSGTGTTSVSVTVGAEAALTVTSPTPLTSVGTNFSNYTGTTTITHFIRTTQSTGSGTLTLKVTTDFSPANGPSVGSPPTGTDKLAYTCSVTGTGTACVGSQTAATGSATPVVTYGADAHTATFPGGDSATTSWTLTNDPKYKTGTYSATVTFTIAAV